MSFPITIYHNPKCSNSRKALATIEAAGHKPTVVEYLKTGWTKAQLKALLAQMKAGPQAILRRKEALVAELGLKEARDEAVLDAMVAHPVLVERPIVVTPKGAALCRPPETVLTLLG